MARDMTKMVERINELIALDMDAVQSHQTAIERIDVAVLRDQLRAFRMDHERHVRELTDVVNRLGGKPREKRDLKGFILQGFTAISGQMGVEAVMKAMQVNEKLTNRTYQKAVDEEVVRRGPGDHRAELRRRAAPPPLHRGGPADPLLGAGAGRASRPAVAASGEIHPCPEGKAGVDARRPPLRYLRGARLSAALDEADARGVPVAAAPRVLRLVAADGGDGAVAAGR